MAETPSSDSSPKDQLTASSDNSTPNSQFSLNDPTKTLYIFTGLVHPHRARVDLLAGPQFPPVFFAQTSDGNALRIGLQINLNQITIYVQADRPIDDFESLRNEVRDITALFTDALGFVVGCGYDVEITQGFHISPGIPPQPRIFGVGILQLEQLVSDAGVSFRDVATILGQRPQYIPFLRRCFADLRSSIRYPADTAFFCYRAIESLMKCHMAENPSITNESNVWDSFRKTFSLQKNDIYEVKNLADPVRHGKPLVITWSDREKALTITWKAVISFLQYTLKSQTS